MSTAAMETLQMLSMVIAPSGISDAGAQHYHFVTGQLDTDSHACLPHCPYSTDLLATGASSAVPITGPHAAADAERAHRAARRRDPRVRAGHLIDRILDHRR
jgi:hypothetical protein